jgi:two-component system chemotaxis sensor kinase CheA
MDDIISGFRDEVRELLLHIEDDLLRLEKSPGDEEIINNIFRIMHTLKGSAGMVGFRNIQDLTHEFEGVYEQIRKKNMAINSEIIDLTLQGKDLIVTMLSGENDSNTAADLIEALRNKLKLGKTKSGEQLSGNSPDSLSNHSYVIIFSPDKAIFERGLDPDRAVYELKSLGETHILLHEKKKSWEIQKAEKSCQTIWEVYLNTSMTCSDVEEIFLFYDQDEFQVFEISREDMQIDAKLREKLTKLYKNKITPEQQLKNCLSLLPELENDLSSTDAKENGKTLIETQSADAVKTDSESNVNVSSAKLDELMNLVSELVTSTAILEVQASEFNDPKLKNTIENIEKLTKKFRNTSLDLRLVPVGTLLSRYKRQVRDLSKDLGKKVNLIIEGQDIEIDKTILKSIESPLQHIIRNSIDHGLEKEEERAAKGKTPAGLLKITAFYSGANVVLQVQDDGGGINLDRVKECAINKGLIKEDQIVTKQDLINLIMEPGFTTSENISLVSGRGVGMDVVRKELNVVGGSLEIFTEKDLGTSIIMKLPTTLTIIDTLMINVGDSHILIPILDIEYCFKGNRSALFDKDNKYIEFKNNPIPLVSLREQFKYPAYDQEELMVIVINKFDRRYAVVADRIISEHQAVIKPLGELFINQPFFSGGSIMIDGKLALILDTNFLFNHATKN